MKNILRVLLCVLALSPLYCGWAMQPNSLKDLTIKAISEKLLEDGFDCLEWLKSNSLTEDCLEQIKEHLISMPLMNNNAIKPVADLFLKTNTLTGQSPFVSLLLLSEDGTRFLVNYLNNKTCLWDTATRTPLAIWQNQGTLEHTLISPDNQFIVTISVSGVITTRDQQGTVLGAAAQLPTYAQALAISKDSTTLCLACNNKKIYIFDSNMTHIQTINSPKNSIISHLAIDPVQNLLVAIDKENYVYVWNMLDNSIITTFYIGDKNHIMHVGITNQDAIVISFLDLAYAKVWNGRTGICYDLTKRNSLYSYSQTKFFMPGIVRQTRVRSLVNNCKDALGLIVASRLNTKGLHRFVKECNRYSSAVSNINAQCGFIPVSAMCCFSDALCAFHESALSKNIMLVDSSDYIQYLHTLSLRQLLLLILISRNNSLPLRLDIKWYPIYTQFSPQVQQALSGHGIKFTYKNVR